MLRSAAVSEDLKRCPLARLSGWPSEQPREPALPTGRAYKPCLRARDVDAGDELSRLAIGTDAMDGEHDLHRLLRLHRVG